MPDEPDILQTPRGSVYRRLFVKAANTTPTPEPPPVTINPNTRITVGLVVTILAVGIGATWQLARVVTDQFAGVRDEIASLKTGLDAVKTDRYTLTAASETALRTAIENPGMRVPDPRNPAHVFVVDTAIKAKP